MAVRKKDMTSKDTAPMGTIEVAKSSDFESSPTSGGERLTIDVKAPSREATGDLMDSSCGKETPAHLHDTWSVNSPPSKGPKTYRYAK